MNEMDFFQTGRFTLKVFLSVNGYEPLRADPSPWTDGETVYTFQATPELVELVRQWHESRHLPYSKSLRILLKKLRGGKGNA